MSRPSKWGEVDYAARLAGLADEENGYDRTADARTLFPAPEAELVETEDGQGIRYSGVPEESSEADGLLEGFIRLSTAEPEEILDYARRFGLLRICRHGLPHQHWPQPYPLPEQTISPKVLDHLAERGKKPSEVLSGVPLTTWCWSVNVEPLSIWRHFAAQAKAILGIAAHVHRGKVGRPEDWGVVYRRSDRDVPWWEQGVRIERLKVARAVDEWLQMTGARPVVSWHLEDEVPTIEIAAHGLFQNLARDLALTVSRADGLMTCRGCGNPYPPHKWARKYCKRCQDDGVPARIRKRRQRARERGEDDGTDNS